MNFKDKPPVTDSLLKKRISRILSEHGNYSESVAAVISNLYDYMRAKKLHGGCHALSSALFVALSELNLKPSLYIGECGVAGNLPFDHSWITVDNKVVDLAIYIPLTKPINSVSGPVVLGIDAVTMKPTTVTYGLNTELPLDEETNYIIRTSFSKYMSSFPMERGGLWAVVQKVMPREYQTSTESLIKKYADVQRICVR